MGKESNPPDKREAEITPEMIEAGRAAFDEFYAGDGRYLLTDDAIRSLFGAMLRSSRSISLETGR